MAEINVVPYIDVMLVLLIIFMVTAPMLMQGVKVELPQAQTEPVENQDSEPVIVSINAQGQLFLNLGAQEDQVLSLATVKQRVGAVIRRSPEKPVLVWGDRDVPYGQVVGADGGAPGGRRHRRWPGDRGSALMRDWFSLGQMTLLPLAATLALHALVLAALLLRWQDRSEVRTIEARVLPPAIINATLVDAASLKPKPKPKPRRQARPTPERRTAPAPAPAASTASRSPAADIAPTPAAKAPPRAAPPPAQERRISAQELAAISRRELAASIAAEDAAQVEMTAEQMAASYAALIRETVTGYWSRPPSARNGMQALLELRLVPTGEIISVSVVESSGSVAFDRSALNAVDKAGSFPELKNLPSREFEQTFRRFRLLFRPEDLRY
jgi:TolR protein